MSDPCHDPVDDAPYRTRELLAGLRAATGKPCVDCGRALCGHGAVMSWVLGYRGEPRCGGCLAAALHEDQATLAERSLQWVRRRECYLRGWLWASAIEGCAGAERPPCTFGSGAAAVGTPAGQVLLPPGDPDDVEADDDWDAGQLGCGDLVLELRNRMRALEPGSVLAVRAEDPAAPIDLPAWCGLTGHALLAAQHPRYWILRKDS